MPSSSATVSRTARGELRYDAIAPPSHGGIAARPQNYGDTGAAAMRASDTGSTSGCTRSFAGQLRAPRGPVDSR